MPIARHAAGLHGLDYLALGHFHSKTLYADDDGAFRMAYSGTHEATGFTEHASGNVLVVEIPNRGAAPQIQTVRTGSLEWLSYHRKIEQPGEIEMCIRDSHNKRCLHARTAIANPEMSERLVLRTKVQRPVFKSIAPRPSSWEY